MAHRNLIMHYSLFVAMVGIAATGDAYSAVRIGNATKNQYYANQMLQNQYANQIASVNDISDKTPNAPADAAPVTNAQYETCAQIYPNGEFEIARPTAGMGTGGAKTCTAVVELRTGVDTVLARANVASGYGIKCNISEFPESSYTIDAQNVIFPADTEPTVDDVKQVMNQEQRQNAGFKIATAALVGAIGGNISGKNDPGKDGFMGTDKGKIKNTVIGAVGGAAIGAGGAYAGKVGGDMIMSAGVNAAAGAVAANIMAAGDSVLRIEKCKDSDGKDTGESCLWGYVVRGTKLTSNDGSLCNGAECYKYYINLDDGVTVMRCGKDNNNCTSSNKLISISVADKPLETLERKDLDALKDANSFHIRQDNNGNKSMVSGPGQTPDYTYALITGAKIDGGTKEPAMIVGFEDSAFGKKRDKWIDWKDDNKNTPINHRNGNGIVGEQFESEVKLDDFYPMYIDADSGGIVDLGNKARLKSTLIGAGAGGALGAFVAYEGAQSDIDERWVSAVREYRDSLQKFYCATGGRFLSYYNDEIYIPESK